MLDLLFDGDGPIAVAASSPTSSPPATSTSSRRRRSCSRPAASGKMFKITSNAHSLTGDGPAVLYRRGIPMEDMEMFQFHPTGIYKMGILLSEAVRGEGGILRNSDGERFMERYAPTVKDLAPRDMVSRADLPGDPARDAACGRTRTTSTSTSPPPPEQIDAKLPDITEFARIYLGIEPKNDLDPDPADRALRDGRHPDEHPRRGRHRRGGHACCPVSTRPASARACRCTARTASARTRCSTSWCSAARGGQAHGRVRCDRNDARAPADAARRHEGASVERLSRRQATRTSPTSAKSCRTR